MRVTKYMLETYRAGVVEIAVLEKYLDKLAEDERQWKQTDTVKGSSPEFPYLPVTVKVSGIAPQNTEAVEKIKKLQQQTKVKIYKKKLELERQRAAVELWLDTVADPNIRSLIRLHYMMGLSWEDICRTLDLSGDGSTQRKQMNRFWKMQK